MARIVHEPKIVANPDTGLPLKEVAGVSGTVVYRGTTTAVTLEEPSGAAMSQPIKITADSIVPGFAAVGDLPGIMFLDWISGEWVIPLNAAEGVYQLTLEAAEAAAASAATAADAIELADVVDLIAGDNVTFESTEAGLRISSTGGGGGGGGISEVTVDSIQDASALFKTALKQTTQADILRTLGAGTSSLAAGWASGQAAPAEEAFRKNGTARQTVTAPVTFDQAPAVPENSFQPNRVAGLPAALDAKADKTATWVFVFHGSNAAFPRPAGIGKAWWVGTVRPNAFQAGDMLEAPEGLA